MENLIKLAIAKSTLLAAKLVSPVVRPGYMPLGVAPNGREIAARMEKVRATNHANGARVTKQLLSEAIHEKDKTHRIKLKANLLKVKIAFDGIVKNEPDVIASLIVQQMCDGIPGMDDNDNQRRVASTWSAILAPCVVIRERDGLVITPTAMIEAGLSWLEHGYTLEAKMAHEQSKSRFISAHPARMYALLADTAAQMNLNHGDLMISMVMPVLKALSTFEGSMKILSETDIEGADRG